MIDLVNLMSLDLSKNELESLPPNIASLPALRTLNLSENKLTSIDFTLNKEELCSKQSDSFFAPSIERASEPFPKLQTLDLSHNLITAEEISCDNLPKNVESIDLSFNKLGHTQQLVNALSRLPRLIKLDMSRNELGVDPFAILTQSSEPSFPKLLELKLLYCKLPTETIRKAFPDRNISFDVVQKSKSESSNILEVILNPPVIKEAWELEAERRLRPSLSQSNLRAAEEDAPPLPPREVNKEAWEIEAEQGVLTEGAKRRLRASKQPEDTRPVSKSEIRAKPVEKEQWEIDAEHGLLTEGAKRRARAMAVAKQNCEASPGTEGKDSPTSAASSHSIASYYNEAKHMLTLPSALPRPKAHGRAMSLAARLSVQEQTNPLLPDATLPLAKIVYQSFAGSLRVLTLSNRRVNPCFDLPVMVGQTRNSPLPMLDELYLISCGLAETISVTREGSGTGSEPLLVLISTLFPSLSVLDISHNTLTSLRGIETLIVPDWDKRRKGLKVFKAQGNRINTLDEIGTVCDGFKNDAKIDGWRLEEIDIRDNDIQKLPPAIGLLPLDVLLVDGNT